MSEVFKTNAVAIRVPKHVFDACVECGEPITGIAEVNYLAEMAWHRECGPMNRSMREYLSAMIAPASGMDKQT
jgi:hypothetical protein